MSGPHTGGPGGGRPPMRGGGPGRGGPMGFAAMPVAKPKNFRGSFRRLIGELRPERRVVIAVMLLAIVSVVLAILGPKILGNATNILFDGVIGKQLPAGVTKAQAVAGLRAANQPNLADMLASMNVTPGQGVDFGALGGVLLLVTGIYAVSSMFSWGQAYLMAGVTQRTVYRLRRRVDEKLGRVPLSYFDRESRGDILSRVTNDIDNIAQTLQQSLTQLITSVFTVIGVLIMMFSISPLLAGISLLVVPAALVVTILIASRSQKQFARQWERTGTLNGHVEEMHTGHAIVKAFGRQQEAIDKFEVENEALFQASYKAQFISGHHPAGDEHHLEPELRRDLRHRRRAGRVGDDVPGRRPGLHPVLAPVHDADRPDGQHHERPAVGGRLRRAGLRAPRRGEEVPDAATARPSHEVRAASCSTTSRSATSPTCRSSRT